MKMYKRCYNCKFFALQDQGYSNYTVLETEIHCLKKHFEPQDESYSWRRIDNPEKDHAFYKQAETCQDYVKENGVQVYFDVDGDVKLKDFITDSEVYQAACEYGYWHQ